MTNDERVLDRVFVIGHYAFVIPSSLVGHWWGIRHSRCRPLRELLAEDLGVVSNIDGKRRMEEHRPNPAGVLIPRTDFEEFPSEHCSVRAAFLRQQFDTQNRRLIFRGSDADQRIADFVSDAAGRQKLLEELDLNQRLRLLIQYLRKETGAA